MSDNLVLYGPGGASPVNLGSWLRADPGPDFGARGLVQAVEAESFGDGGQFVYDRAGIRHMGFPLRPASGGAGLSLTALESLIRLNARPGGYLDVQPEGTPSAEAVRFDIVHGRWEPDYSVFMQRAVRREGVLLLDTQPYGYWPTQIILASAGFASGPLIQLAWNPAAIIGDAPAFAEINIIGSAGATNISGMGGGNAHLDGLLWSLGRPTTGAGAPSPVVVPTFWQVATAISGQGSMVATQYAEANTPIGALLRVGLPSFYWGTWTNIMVAPESTLDGGGGGGLIPGRYRTLAWVRAWPSGLPWQLSLDEQPQNVFPGAKDLASSYPVATLITRQNGSYPDSTASGFQLVDLGVHSWPPAYASSLPTSGNAMTARLWAKPASQGAGMSTYAHLEFGGLYVLPADNSGALTSGFSQPTTGAFSGAGIITGAFQNDGINKRVLIGQVLNNQLASAYDRVLSHVQADGRFYHRGGYPYVSSHGALDVLLFSRNTGAGATAVGPMHANILNTGASVRYRPRFQFLKGL